MTPQERVKVEMEGIGKSEELVVGNDAAVLGRACKHKRPWVFGAPTKELNVR